MANLSKDVQCAENGENILQSIDEGLFKMGKFRETLVEGTLHLGLEQDRVFTDLTLEEKERFKADIRATNILLQGSKLTKDERESQLYDDFEHFHQNKDRNFDDDVDEPPIQDLALNVDNVFPADQCDAFNFDVDEAPTTQTMFMVNLSSANPIYDEAGPSYDSDIISEVQDHDNSLDSVDEYQENNAEQVVQKDTLKIAEITRKKMLEKMKSPLWIEGVNSSTEASGSKPKSNIKNNRILPAKSDNKKKVEDHPRNNKSNLKQKKHVDSIISSKRTVVQIVLWYLDSGCSKNMMRNRSWLKNFMKKFTRTDRFRNDHFGSIMGYGYYVIGDSVISRVYYVEGLENNLFYVGQFCDSDFEVAFRKHSYYVRDVDGVKLLKGPEPILMTPRQINSGLVPNPVPVTTYVPPTIKDLKMLFQPMFDEYFEYPSVERPVAPTPATQVPVNSAGTPSFTTIDQDEPSTSYSPSSSEVHDVLWKKTEENMKN
nr:integrase, catalytic region, zinc finger, CCHC-type, peptidase aspartic, catalytic [Tanacetum cinerariifolium]